MTIEETKTEYTIDSGSHTILNESRDDWAVEQPETIELREKAPLEETPQCRGCCSCPNGPLAAAAIVCTIVAKFLSDSAAGLCSFVEMEESGWIIPREVGIFRYYDEPDSSGNTHCVFFYEGEDEGEIYGTIWTAVHVLVGIGGLIGLACFLFACSATCTEYPLRHFRASIYLQLLLFLLYGLSFMVLGSNGCNEKGCELGSSAFVMLAAVPLWLVSSLLWLLHVYPSESVRPSSSTTFQIRSHGVPRARKMWALFALSALFIVVLVNLMVTLVREKQQTSSDDWAQPGGGYEEIDCQNYFEGPKAVCGSGSYSCVMRVELESLDPNFSCAAFCSRHGADCIETPASFLTRGAECGGIDSTQYFYCDTVVRRNVCTCSVAPANLTYQVWGQPLSGPLTNPPLPPEPTHCERVYSPEGFDHICEETTDRCTLYVAMNNVYQNCEMFCVHYGGSCLGAAADDNDGCTVQEFRDCAEPAGDMICICSL